MKQIHDFEFNILAFIYMLENNCSIDHALYKYGLIDKSPMYYRKLNDEVIEQIIEQTQNGKTYSDLELTYGLKADCLKSRVYRYKKRKEKEVIKNAKVTTTKTNRSKHNWRSW